MTTPVTALFGVVASCLTAFPGCRGCEPRADAVEAPVATPAATRLAAEPATIEGVVTIDGRPQSGATVHLYTDVEAELRGPAAFESPPTGVDGAFRFTVPPGVYYLIATGGDQIYGYFGGNPEELVAGQELFVRFAVVRHQEADAATLPPLATGQGVNGMVFQGTTPVAGAQVLAYMDLSTELRGAPVAQTLTDARGRFALDLDRGRYFLVARKRQSGMLFGPLAVGDAFAYHDRNPVIIRGPGAVPVALSSVVRDAGYYKSEPRPTRIDGIVLDDQRRPVAGIFVGAYRGTLRAGRPDAVANATTTDGRFSLTLPEGGRYALMARRALGHRAAPGELVGVYTGSPDGSVGVDGGSTLTDVEIVVTPFPEW
ncbi:MAG: hypothetical protein HY903_07605 [Deltaproteobacteria bacterium]|nr:hypothetical protein [Deltaproteobacteria bacterium]